MTIHAIRAPGDDDDAPTPAENLATLRGLPGYTEVDVHYVVNGHSHTNRLMARGLPQRDDRFCRRFTDLTYGTEMHFDSSIGLVPDALHPVRIDVNESTLPKCPGCGVDPVQVDGSPCADCAELNECSECGDGVGLDGYDGMCGDCADVAAA